MCRQDKECAYFFYYFITLYGVSGHTLVDVICPKYVVFGYGLFMGVWCFYVEKGETEILLKENRNEVKSVRQNCLKKLMLIDFYKVNLLVKRYKKMNIKKWITENTALLSILMIAIGIILVLLSKLITNNLLKSILESFGIVFTSVFFISLLYEKFLAEKHFIQFREVIRKQLKEMDNIQSNCNKLGIKEIFEDRNHYENKYNIFDIFSRIKENGKILVVARSLFHLLNKTNAIRAALRKGGQLQLACVKGKELDETLREICFLKRSDIKTPLEVLKDILCWIENEKPIGSLELRIYSQPLPDSLLYAELEDKNLIIWDLTFGRDLSQKKVFVIDKNENNFGNDLFNRYNYIWNTGKTYLKVNTMGDKVMDKLNELIED